MRVKVRIARGHKSLEASATVLASERRRSLPFKVKVFAGGCLSCSNTIKITQNTKVPLTLRFAPHTRASRGGKRMKEGEGEGKYAGSWMMAQF